MWLFFRCLPPWFAQPHPHGFFQRKSPGNQVVMGQMFVGLTLQDKLVSSKHFIPVALENPKSLYRKHVFTLVDKVYYLKYNLPTIFQGKKIFLRVFTPQENAYVLRFLWVLCSGVKKHQQQPTFSRMTQQCASRQINRRWFWAWPRQ